MKYYKFVKQALKENSEHVPFYTNNKNEKVECDISEHVRERIVERFYKLTETKIPEDKIDLVLVNLFNNSTKIGKKNPTYVNRNKKHGGGSLYFQNNHLVFVVSNRVIKTVEIVTERELN